LIQCQVPNTNQNTEMRQRKQRGLVNCQFCENPVQPIAELDYGSSVGTEFVIDTNPICEDCSEKGLVPKEIDNDPFKVIYE
jgi:hypothetical protein